MIVAALLTNVATLALAAVLVLSGKWAAAVAAYALACAV